MGFKEDLQKLSTQIAERKPHVANEEMAKQVLVMPFLQVLGFDVFNPLEVKPEYTADFGKKKGEKVDYAIFKDGIPVMFIEAKPPSENPDNHDAQLARYFNATPEVRIAILTNGIIYKFFTDLTSNNVMDQAPFQVIDITDLSSADIEVLNSFRKDRFETESLVRYAEELIYTSNLNAKLKDIFKNPPDDFIRYLIKDFSDKNITRNVIERFRPIVKKSINLALIDIVSQGIFQQEAAVENNTPQPETLTEQETEEPSPDATSKVVTTEEEETGLAIVKSILEKHNRDVSSLGTKDTTVYYAIFTKNIFNWFLRVKLDSQNKQVITRLPVKQVQALAQGFNVEAAPKGLGESRIYINSHNDLIKLEELVLACFDIIELGMCNPQ